MPSIHLLITRPEQVIKLNRQIHVDDLTLVSAKISFNNAGATGAMNTNRWLTVDIPWANKFDAHGVDAGSTADSSLLIPMEGGARLSSMDIPIHIGGGSQSIPQHFTVRVYDEAGVEIAGAHDDDWAIHLVYSYTQSTLF